MYETGLLLYEMKLYIQKAPITVGDGRFVTQLLKTTDYSAALRISIILIADCGIRVPGPKIAATPALYKKS